MTVKDEKLFTNFAPVLYDVPDSYFTELGYRLMDLDAGNEKPSKPTGNP